MPEDWWHCGGKGYLPKRCSAGTPGATSATPQLERFRAHPYPLGAIGAYLLAVSEEARLRGYSFSRSKIAVPESRPRSIKVTEGQMRFETSHLATKIKRRDPGTLRLLDKFDALEQHPCFVVVPGPIASWELARM